MKTFELYRQLQDSYTTQVTNYFNTFIVPALLKWGLSIHYTDAQVFRLYITSVSREKVYLGEDLVRKLLTLYIEDYRYIPMSQWLDRPSDLPIPAVLANHLRLKPKLWEEFKNDLQNIEEFLIFVLNGNSQFSRNTVLEFEFVKTDTYKMDKPDNITPIVLGGCEKLVMDYLCAFSPCGVISITRYVKEQYTGHDTRSIKTVLMSLLAKKYIEPYEDDTEGVYIETSYYLDACK
jgi:hypothetical protein